MLQEVLYNHSLFLFQMLLHIAYDRHIVLHFFVYTLKNRSSMGLLYLVFRFFFFSLNDYYVLKRLTCKKSIRIETINVCTNCKSFHSCIFMYYIRPISFIVKYTSNNLRFQKYLQ